MGSMDYGSLSTIVVLAIVVIAMVVWLPKRTVDSMKRVIEHREDRYSSSLHLVDAQSGTRFSDGYTPEMKGATMQPKQARGARLTQERIAQIRQMRRQAIRRRQMLVAALVVVTILVFAGSFALHFSPWFAVIPVVLLAVVLALGARAAQQARHWEQRVAEQRKSTKEPVAGDAEGKRSAAGERLQRDEVTQSAEDSAPTDVLEQREIRQALRRAQMDKARAMERRQDNVGEPVDVKQPISGQVDVQAVAEYKQASHDELDAQSPAVHEEGAEHNEGLNIAEESQASDATDELHQVHPAKSLDVFDMAVPAQDLISFSLGAPRNGIEQDYQAPESMEIKSTVQVAKAVAPQEEPERSDSDLEADAVDDVDLQRNRSAQAYSASDKQSENQSDDTSAFHNAEVHAQVDVPDATADSLGADLEAVLARRTV
ncbi:YjbE family integral membrane protein [Bifidobacterium tsurumiense]|uniref:YjbE family integral membrane protein n=3 Tax=Bifidobacterium tsurumiense TaxID=356829 RepID=A0A087ECD3_9BIFI|nr:YjbE family integral membrane protein [Bifidobacterium tsurumiense]